MRLNYKHLRYFWMTARAGGVLRAAERLNVTPQTISGQIRLLEDQLGDRLFTRVGRHLELTETGRMVLGYADEIFSLGSELEEMLRTRPPGRRSVFRVGVADVVPKSVAYRLLAPALALPGSMRIVCREHALDALLAELAVHRLDLVIADGPMPEGLHVRGFTHALGECGVSFFAAPELAARLQGAFPRCLDGAPLLLPGEHTVVRGRLQRWLGQERLRPRIVGEFDDSALMKTFGRAGVGVFIAPSPIEQEVCEQYGVRVLGRSEAIRDHYYAISVERRISHPAVVAITEAARDWLTRP